MSFIESCIVCHLSPYTCVTDVWGFDTAAVTVLRNMEAPDSDKRLISKYAVLLSNSSELLRETTINVSDILLLFLIFILICIFSGYFQSIVFFIEQLQLLTRFNKIATQGAPQMAVDKEANSLSRVYSYYSKFNLCLFYV